VVLGVWSSLRITVFFMDQGASTVVGYVSAAKLYICDIVFTFSQLEVTMNTVF
jgi:hypothetical protein